MKKVFLYSGQGSQYVGMLKDLYESNTLAKDLVDKADDILGYSLSDICFEGPTEKLTETKYTQPAIFLHSAILNDLLKDLIKNDAVAGHSVGEYAALYGAGVIDFENALKLVSLRGNLMFEAGKDEPGTMFAVIGLDDAEAIRICKELSDNSESDIIVAANFNSPGQIVVSGSQEYLRENAQVFKENGAKLVKELKVSGAFHSPLMKPAKEKLAEAIEKIEFNPAKVPVYTNVSAKAETMPDRLKKNLIEQLTSPVLWTQTLENLQNDDFTDYIEIGPGKVLQGLTKRTLTGDGINISGFDKVSDLENI